MSFLSNNEGNKFYAWIEGAQLLKNRYHRRYLLSHQY